MDIPALTASRPYRPETIALLHDAFEAFWHKDPIKAWKLSVLASASPLLVEFRPGPCAPQISAALNAEFAWAMDELHRITYGCVDLRDSGRFPGDIEVEVAHVDWSNDVEGSTVYGRDLSPLPADLASLSIHGQISISRRFLAAHWRDQVELRRVCLGFLGEVLGLQPTDVESMWCARTSTLPARQIQALCALQDVREFFERQPSIQNEIRLPVWPRHAASSPTHAMVRTRSALRGSPTDSTAWARPPKGVS